MFAGKRSRALAALMLAATAAGVMVAVTTSGAAPNELHLHLGTDGRYFQYGNTTQNLTLAPNSCKITSAEPLIDVMSNGSTAPGLGPDNSMGVRSNQGGNGTPCSQVDQTESLTLKPGTAMTGKSFSGVRMDLEMTGNASVTLTLASPSNSATYKLLTGTSITPAQAGEPDYVTTVPYTVSSSPGDTTDACAAPNSSGPNSGPNDNCQWTVQPEFDFTTLTLTTTAGTVSLEGSADFANNPAFDTVFYLSNTPPVANDDTADVPQNATTDVVVLGNDTDIDSTTLTPTSIGNLSPSTATAVANPDGTIAFTPPAGYFGPASFTYKANDGQADSNTATVNLTVYRVICSNETVTDADGAVTGSFTRLDDTFNCKRYELDASSANGTILFQPSGATDVDYRGYVSFGGTTAPVGPFPLLLEYDPFGGNTFQPVQWCINPQFDGGGNVTTATLPGIETWCIASADTRPNGIGDLVTTWQVFGHDDPRFR